MKRGVNIHKPLLSGINLELTTFKGLSKLPTSRNDIIVDECSSIAGCDFEGEGLAIEVGIALPILSPVP